MVRRPNAGVNVRHSLPSDTPCYVLCRSPGCKWQIALIDLSESETQRLLESYREHSIDAGEMDFPVSDYPTSPRELIGPFRRFSDVQWQAEGSIERLSLVALRPAGLWLLPTMRQRQPSGSML
jgi:hypothetical protein